MELIEVAPRDGLQNEVRILPAAVKAELFRRAVADGARRVETVSFVHPDRVPQMADAEQVLALLDLESSVSVSGLVLNRRGLERALATGVHEVNVVVLATETFSRRNQGMSVDAAAKECLALTSEARLAGLRTTVTVGAAFGCPFEGEVAPTTVQDLVAQLLTTDVDELCLADTIGVAVPRQVHQLARTVRAVSDVVPLRGHFHDTRNTGVANVLAAAEAGFRALDVSVGGIGGCPFAPAATGNVATEDAIYALDRSGWPTSRNGQVAASTGEWIRQLLGKHTAGSALSRAGAFPDILCRNGDQANLPEHR